MMLRILVAFALLGTACGTKPVSLENYNTRLVILPDGYQVRCEVMTHPTDMMRGMMFRDSLAEDRGMLFIHASMGPYSYWMHQVKIPLDILWLDENRIVVEISADTPPCTTEKASECPNYGGSVNSIYVVELAAGSAAKHNIKVGTLLRF